jgi:hypothetical protein
MALGEIPEEMLKDLHNFPPLTPSISDMIGRLNDEVDEMLLAALAAGVPANCIALEGPSKTFNWKDGGMINLGFRFTGAV